MKYTLTGWPQCLKDVITEARPYHGARHELSVANGLLLRDCRIVIPTKLRPDLLTKIHHGHQGVTKCRERAKQGVWWPGVSQNIADMVAKCQHCITNKHSQHNEPLIPTTLPERPWQHIGADMMTFQNKEYLILMDYYSRYLEVVYTPTTTSKAIVEKMKNIFAQWRIPERITSDNGPQFSSEMFKVFANTYEIVLTPSSSGFPQSHGLAESGVQIAKKILCDPEPSLALMVYRATPVASTGFSPSELLLGRRIRTTLPMIPNQLSPKTPDQDSLQSHDSKSRYSHYYNRRHGVRELSPLRKDDKVRVKLDDQKSWTISAKVIEPHESPRSYIINADGTTYRRNRKHLMKIPVTTNVTDKENENVNDNNAPHDEPQQNETDLDVQMGPKIKPKRSTRISKLPNKYKDFNVI